MFWLFFPHRQLFITTEDACNKLVEKKIIILASDLGNFNPPSVGPNPLGPKVRQGTHGRAGTQRRERKGQASSIPSRGLLFIRHYLLKVPLCWGPGL